MLDPMRSRYIHGHLKGQGATCVECLRAELATAKDREAGLTKALAEVQADLERAREVLAVGLTNDELKVLRLRLKQGEYDGVDIMHAWFALAELLNHRAALAPEQKGHPETSEPNPQL